MLFEIRNAAILPGLSGLQPGVQHYVTEARNQAVALDSYAKWLGFRSAVHMKYEWPSMDITIKQLPDDSI